MMKNLFLVMLACGLLTGPMVADAIPIGYNVTYAASTGPNGTGSFSFDNDVGVITGFGWNFDDGAVGGLPDFLFGPEPSVLGDTSGRFLFELLTQTDVHSTVNCLAPNGCGFYSFFDGTGPVDSLGLGISANITVGSLTGGIDYAFYATSFEYVDANIVASGVVTVSQAASVPEPSTLLLCSAAFLGLCLMPKRRTRAV